MLVLSVLLTQNQSQGKCPPSESRHRAWTVEHSQDERARGRYQVPRGSRSAERGEAADGVRSTGDEAGDRRRICVTPSQEVLPGIS